MKHTCSLSLAAVLMAPLMAATPADTNGTQLGTVTITDAGDTLPVQVLRDATISQTVINAKGLQRSMGAGGSNIFKSVELAPSVNVQTDDPFGFSGGTMRVRGFTEREIGTSIDGMPLNDSGNFAVYPHEFTDAENLDSVALTRGSSKSSAPFYSDIGGSVNMYTRHPEKKFGGEIAQNVGMYGFYRGFYRVDSGQLSTGTKAFASYSHSHADKWKGPGKSPDFRDHFAFGVVQEFGDIHAELFYDFNAQLNDSYKNSQMNWEQAQNFEAFYDTDYGMDANEGSYYKLNTNPYTNQLIRGRVSIPLTSELAIDIKPYMWIGKGGGYYSYGSTNKITYNKSLNYTDRPGVTAQLSGDYDNSHFETGVWYEYSNLKNFSKSYAGSNGDTMLNDLNAHFNYWRYIQETATTTTAPFISWEQKDIADMLDVTVGLKYAMVRRDLKSYKTGDVNGDYNDADVYDHLGAIDTARTYDETYAKLLPRLQLGLNLKNDLYPFFSYARTFKVPDNSQAGSIDASSFAANLDPEVADTFDLGLRYTAGDYFVAPVVFYTLYTDKIISAEDPHDPTSSYPQNVGETTAYGFEIEAGARLNDNFSLYGSYGYTKASFENNYASGGTIIDVEGNQLQDTPEHTLNGSIEYAQSGFTVITSAKYISSRYGDATNTQKVNGYTVVNFDVRKDFELMGMKLSGVASVRNLFDAKYIGKINTGDTSATYYAGSPVATSIGISAKY